MFINCRHCHALVATNPATDEPPERCPRCGGMLRDTTPPDAGADATTDHPAPAAPSVDGDLRDDAMVAPESGAAGTGDDPAGAGRRAADLVAALSARDERQADALASQEPADEDQDDEDQDDAAAAEAIAAAIDADPNARAGDTPPADAVSASDSTAHRNDAGGHDDAIAVRGDGADAANAASASDATPVPAPEAGADTPGEPSPVPRDAPAPGAPAPGSKTKAAPSFVATRRRAPAATPRQRWLVPGIVAALSSLLLLQVLLADRARLSADARWRPLLSGLCGMLGCTLPPWREPAAFRLVARDVRAHPQRPGVLRATATFRNDARWAQAWPRVVLTLSDVEGRAIGRRDFAPAEYLGDEPTENALASGQSAMILLDVVEPAANVVAFSFEFH